MPKLFFGGLELSNVKCNNFWIRRFLIRSSDVIPMYFKWGINYNFLSNIKIWAGVNKFQLPNKMK